MKILWLVPPAKIKGRIPNVGQYRFYKLGNADSIIYPYLNASGVTLLNKAGIETKFIDCPTEKKDWSEILQPIRDADYVVLEARTPVINYIWSCCQKIKEINPDVKTILFGDHVSWNAPESTSKPGVDYVVRGGDYDLGILNLIQSLDIGIVIYDRTYNQPLVQDLDTLPIVDRELVNWRNYREAWSHRKVFLWTMSSRGCFFPCIFCAWRDIFWKGKLRLRSPAKVADEYEMLFKKYGECEILDDADLFKTDWGVTFATQLLSKGFSHNEIIWAYQTHPNEIYGPDNFYRMHKAGLEVVKLGIESLNQETLNHIRKGLMVKQVEKAFKILKDAKIMIHANLMIGFPFETRGDVEKTVNMLNKLQPNQAQFSLAIPYPWTNLYEDAKANGWLLVTENDWSCYDARRPMLTMQGLKPSEIVDLYKWCWSHFYFNKKYMAKHILGSLHSPGDLVRLWHGYKSIRNGHLKSME